MWAKKTYITEKTDENLNKTVNEAVSNAMIKSNSNCTGENSIFQSISFKECQTTGNSNVNNVPRDAVLVDFSCVNVFKAENEMAQALLSELVSSLQNNIDAESLNNMNAAAVISTAIPSIVGGTRPSNSTNKNTYNLTNVNNNNTDIQNVVSNIIQTDFGVESIQHCMSKAGVKQTQDYSACKAGGKINVDELKQNANMASVVNCVNQSETVRNVINKAANQMGVVVKADTSAVSSSDIANFITTSATSTGIGAFCASCPGGDNPETASICAFVGFVFLLCCLSSSGTYSYNNSS
jgi:hypothetical protein